MVEMGVQHLELCTFSYCNEVLDRQIVPTKYFNYVLRYWCCKITLSQPEGPKKILIIR